MDDNQSTCVTNLSSSHFLLLLLHSVLCFLQRQAQLLVLVAGKVLRGAALILSAFPQGTCTISELGTAMDSVALIIHH